MPRPPFRLISCARIPPSPAAFLSLFFSWIYKLPRAQLLCIHIHANPQGCHPCFLAYARMTIHKLQVYFFQKLAASLSLLPLFFELPSFVFNRLQPLLAKYPGGG